MINTEGNPSFLNSFLDYTATILNKSPNTIKEYNYDLNNFLKFILVHFKMTDLKDYKEVSIRNMTIKVVEKISLDDIHSYLFFLNNNLNSKAATRARKIACIRTFFNYLTTKAGLLEKNPAQNLESPKLDKRLPKYLSLDDSKKLLEAATNIEDRNKERDFAILTLFLNCGMRLSELVGINFKDIDFSDCKLNIIGKGNKERTIYLNKACIKAVNDYIKIRPRDSVKYNSKDALFLSERKERISNRTVQHIVKQELLRAGLDPRKYSVHKLRHTAATLMYQYGDIDIRALQELLGHESISTTEIYTHVSNNQVRNAVESNPLANY
ncbi:MAG TPA: tyrosine recombinase XerC [Clostridia bacterium]|nr:tyrosine recombinase XerC [Clostridia bacterium]